MPPSVFWLIFDFWHAIYIRVVFAFCFANRPLSIFGWFWVLTRYIYTCGFRFCFANRPPQYFGWFFGILTRYIYTCGFWFSTRIYMVLFSACCLLVFCCVLAVMSLFSLLWLVWMWFILRGCCFAYILAWFCYVFSWFWFSDGSFYIR